MLLSSISFKSPRLNVPPLGWLCVTTASVIFSTSEVLNDTRATCPVVLSSSLFPSASKIAAYSTNSDRILSSTPARAFFSATDCLLDFFPDDLLRPLPNVHHPNPPYHARRVMSTIFIYFLGAQTVNDAAFFSVSSKFAMSLLQMNPPVAGKNCTTRFRGL